MDYCPHDIEESIIDFFTSRLLHFSTKGSMRSEVQILSPRPSIENRNPGPDDSLPVDKVLSELEIPHYITGKTNVGLGRPLAEGGN